MKVFVTQMSECQTAYGIPKESVKKILLLNVLDQCLFLLIKENASLFYV